MFRIWVQYNANESLWPGNGYIGMIIGGRSWPDRDHICPHSWVPTCWDLAIVTNQIFSDASPQVSSCLGMNINGTQWRVGYCWIGQDSFYPMISDMALYHIHDCPQAAWNLRGDLRKRLINLPLVHLQSRNQLQVCSCSQNQFWDWEFRDTWAPLIGSLCSYWFLFVNVQIS